MSELNLQIAKFSSTHVREVAEIEAVSYRDPWSAESFREILALTDASWVALADELVIGYLITQWVLDEIHVLNLAVKSEFRKHGIASKLITTLFDLGVQRGMRDLFLEVRVSNLAAQNLYRKFGFAILATRKCYYPDAEDAFIMYRQLPSADDGADATAVMDEQGGNAHGD
jgi:ribosomal-protein-alanine N-acetyltransferase